MSCHPGVKDAGNLDWPGEALQLGGLSARRNQRHRVGDMPHLPKTEGLVLKVHFLQYNFEMGPFTFFFSK